MGRFSTLAAIVLGCLCSCMDKQDAQNDYPILPVSFTEVSVTDNFWAERIKTNHNVTIPIAIEKSRETGRIDNFAIAAGLKEGVFCSPYPFDDSDVYKIIEGAAYSLQMFPDKKLEQTIDSLIYLIGEAQEDDGYLYTNRTIMGANAHEWAGKKRWEKEDILSHELYNLGHFYEAATAYFQTTGKQKIMDIAIKSADLIYDTFGYGKIENYPGHQEVEIGLVKLYRVTGNKKYLELAKFFLDIRGKGSVGEKKTYNQSHLPVTEQNEAVGHSVRGAYMWSGMADMAALTGDKRYLDAITKIWEDIVYKKLYITGGIGAEGGFEGFGGPYELPNMRAYCETCAAIANVFWNHRMFLMTGDAKYIDVLERSLYNNVLSGVSLSGDRFFYPNPLESHGQHQRSEWFGCACCPSNISRFIPSMPNYIYARKGREIYVNLFVQSEVVLKIENNILNISQQTNMPWDGNVIIKVNPSKPENLSLKVRVPGWALNSPVPGDLYRFYNQLPNLPVIRVNGKEENFRIENGYVKINRKWKRGDSIEIGFPFEIRKILANEKIEDDRGKMALQLGPLVYCAEWADYKDPDILSMAVDKDAELISEYNPDILGGITMIRGDAFGIKKVGSNGDTETYPRLFRAIPYYAWAHRGPGQMAVWIPTEAGTARPKPLPAIASSGKLEASYPDGSLFSVNDQLFPENPADKSNLFYDWWPRKNQAEWIICNFEKAETVSSSGVYWFTDTPGGGCDLPASWRLFYKSGESWKPVKTGSPYPLVKDSLNKVFFEPVETSALKLEVQLSADYSAGIYEWVID